MKKIIYFTIFLFIALPIFAQDLIIEKINFTGLSFAKKRVLKELPIKVGGVWNLSEKQKVISYFWGLQNEKILDEGELVKIDEKISNNKVELTLNLNESLPFFFFPMPFWKTTTLLKIKFKFWLFYINGYNFPMDAHIEFSERENLNLYAKYENVILTEDQRLSSTLYFKAYTTAINYMLTYQFDDTVFRNYKAGDRLNKNLITGLEDTHIAFKYIIPNVEATILPSFSFYFKNTITNVDNTTDTTNDVFINPKIDFTLPIPNTRMSLITKFGFAFGNINKEIRTNEKFNDKLSYRRFLFALSNINYDALKNISYSGNDGEGAKPTNDEYLSGIALSNIHLPIIHGSLTSVLWVGYFCSYFTNFDNNNIISNISNFFKIKPILGISIPIPAAKATFYTNLGLGYSLRWDSSSDNQYIRNYEETNKKTFNVDDYMKAYEVKKDGPVLPYIYKIAKVYTNTLTVALNCDDPISNPITSKIVFGIPNYGITISHELGFAYSSVWNTYYQNDKDLAITGYGTTDYHFKNDMKFASNFTLIFPIPIINARGEFYFDISYLNSWGINNKTNEIIENSKDGLKDGLKDSLPVMQKFYIKRFSFLLEMPIKLNEFYLKSRKIDDFTRSKVNMWNSFAILFNIGFPEPTKYNNNVDKFLFTNSIKRNELKLFPNNLVLQFDLLYNLYLPIYKEHIYKMRFFGFARYNDIKIFTPDSNTPNDIRNIDYWFREDRASKFAIFGGFAGILTNIEYRIPLFTVNTAQFFNIPMKKDLIWKVYWTFYTDLGLGLAINKIVDPNNNVFTYDVNSIHLLPALTVGTSLKIYPKFVPVVLNIELSYNIDGKLLNTRNDLASYLFIGFSLERINEGVGNAWFKEQ